ncbi:MAG: hypothetical protein ACTS9Y_05480 [Methylophilus sp.]|uniref:hypothetical protein n=1 Tax=Methylophilus sp. TaxID=29541 RepID=UPI003F9FE7A9
MITSRYWHALRWFLAAWLLVSLLGFALLGFHSLRQIEIMRELKQLKQQLHTTRQQAAHNASYQPDVTFYLLHRARWQQLGINRPADPQQWTASWLALQQQWHLSHMQYDIQPTITCEGAACEPFWPGKPLAGLSMTVTTVQMRWTVNHEADVLDWLQPLQQAYTGMFLLRGCTWALEESTELIVAQCELQLFNFPQMFPASLNPT